MIDPPRIVTFERGMAYLGLKPMTRMKMGTRMPPPPRRREGRRGRKEGEGQNGDNMTGMSEREWLHMRRSNVE